jgi:hypothetical protein
MVFTFNISKRLLIIVIMSISLSWDLAELCILARITNINQIFKKIEVKLSNRFRQSVTMQLIKLLCFLLIVAHFAACSFRIVGKIESNYFEPEEIWTYKVDRNT